MTRVGLVGVGLLLAGSAFAKDAVEVAGFPVEMIPGTGNGISIVDLDADGKPEIVTTTAESLVVLDGSGKVRGGFAVSLHGATDPGRLTFTGAPLGCDLDGDGKPEILVAADNSKLFAVNGRGETVTGFPIKLDGLARGALACLPGAGRASVVLTTDVGSVTRVALGAPPEILARVGKGAESGVALAELNSTRGPELVTVGGDASLYVIDLTGKPTAKALYKMAFRSSGVPAIGDVDDDGKPDIVLASQDFKLHALSASGALLPGFPVETQYRLYAGVALGDLDADGVIDLVVGSGDSKLYAVNGSGKALSGFPVQLDGRVTNDALIGDLDRDGTPEIVVTTEVGSLYVVSATGKVLSGFPMSLGGKPDATSALADLDGDGTLELIVQAHNGSVHVYKLADRNKVPRAQAAWPMLGHDAGHAGHFGPSEGRFKSLTYANPKARAHEPVTASYAFFDLDGDAEAGTQIRWFLNGKRVAELDNQREVPGARTKKHDHWRYTVQDAQNFKVYGESGPLAHVLGAPELAINNTAPSLPTIELTPKDARTGSKLEVKVTKPSVDGDGDTVQYHYTWLKDGRPEHVSATTASIEPSRTKKNEEWRVIVTPLDGENEGESAQAAVTILNTPPTAAKLAVTPKVPKVDDAVRVSIATPATDEDGDTLTYAYRYWVNGKLLALPATTGSIAARLLRKHDKVRVQVTTWDADVAGGQVEAEFSLDNTSPPEPKIVVWPAQPRTDDTLTVSVVSLAEDADRDAIELRHQWYLNTAKVDFPLVVPVNATQKGQRWRLEVTPFDGEVVGPTAKAEVKIDNTPPLPPLVVLDAYEFDTDQPISPRILRPAEDADGDAVQLKYIWRVGGKVQSLPPNTVAIAATQTQKNQDWELEVKPFDGEADGASTFVRFHIKNAPPSAPTVTLSSERPTIRDKVTVNVVTAATDKDQDALSYHYRWYRDGTLVADWPLTKAALEPGDVKKGEQWRVDVRAFDGNDEGSPSLRELRVDNQRPDPPVLVVTPAVPRKTDELACVVKQASVDADGDTVVYRMRWFADDKQVPLPRDATKVPATLLRKGQKWRCEVEAFDGTASSTVAQSTPVVVVNSAPRSPAVSVLPATPSTSTDLTCQLDAPAADDDGDAVTYRFEWLVNGKPHKLEGDDTARVPAGVTARGQSWECKVTANDSVIDGPAVSSKVTIGNTAPSAPRVAIHPDHPVVGLPLQCDIVTPSTDPDSDAVHYRYVWVKNGDRQSFAPTSVDVPARLIRANDVWRCIVTASDGTDNSADIESPDASVEAAPMAGAASATK